MIKSTPIILIYLVAAFSHPAMAQNLALTEDDLTKQLDREKEMRKACKIEICRTIRKQQFGNGPITCNVTKTMPKKDLNEIFSKRRLSWPYGHVQCITELSLPRQALAEIKSKPAHTLKLAPHTLRCTVAREKKDPYKLLVTLTPTIEFKDAKAVKAKLKWGKIEAPMLTKGAIWTVTGMDNRLNIFGGKVVDTMNAFMTKKCDEVKDALE